MKKILVIDDDNGFRNLAAFALRRHDFNVFEAADGLSGVKIARTELPDVVVCDVHMKEVNGHEVLHVLQSEPATAAIPVILVTGSAADNNWREGMEEGADDFLLKPVSTESLVAAVEARLDRRQQIRNNDVIAVQKAKEELEQKTALLEAVVNSSLDGILVIDQQNRKIMRNRQMADLIKIPWDILQNIDGRQRLEMVAQTTTDPEKFLKRAEYLLSKPDETARDEIEFKDGRVLERYSAPVVGRDGRHYGRVWMFRDVTERRRTEQQLVHEHELLNTLMENSSDMIYFKDLESRFIRCSAMLAERMGKTMTEVIGKTDFHFFSEKHAREAFEDEQEIIRSGTPVVGKVEQEFWIDKKEPTWALTTKIPLRNRSGKIVGTFGISKDITALKKAEQDRQWMEVQLRQAQKLEAIGQLAAGIAHEINTPTQYVGDNTRFLKDAFDNIVSVLRSHGELLMAAKENKLTPEVIEHAEEVLVASDLEYLFNQIPAAIAETLEGVERVTKIVRAMKDFSHPGSQEKCSADLNKAIESTITVARNEWKYVADIKLELAPDLPMVPCFIGEFNQVILNLLVNAAHAIGDVVKGSTNKGTITVRTRHDVDSVEICVTDTGTGIAEAHRPRIFEPFFTTKSVGRGTGQGLAMVYTSIVKKHGGTVTFETEAGKGTTFIVRLPVAPKNQGSAL